MNQMERCANLKSAQEEVYQILWDTVQQTVPVLKVKRETQIEKKKTHSWIIIHMQIVAIKNHYLPFRTRRVLNLMAVKFKAIQNRPDFLP